MRWLRAAVVGLVFAVIGLVAVVAVQAALGMSTVFSGSGGLGAVSIELSGPAVVATVAGFMVGFLYWFRGPGRK